MSRKVKTVSFSLVSEYDTRLLTYAEADERGNFSQYVKRLIDADMSKTPIYAQVQEHIETKPTDEDADAMSGFL
ncbi:hypothetical protein ABE021_10190 [Sporosarcina gallistercoris]|uniref:hypothetical protein n=1 Tax=Sporosarcina gallistercoris TaxID=2762245 RepID=UPI003D28AE86